MKIIKSNISKLLLIAVIPLLFSGCDDLFDDGEITYDGPAQVEFKPLSNTLTLDTDTTLTTEVPVNVQLIGEQRNEDLPLNFVVVDSLTTADSEDYTLPSNDVTIPADSSSTTFTISVTGENLTPGDVVELVLQLQGNEEQGVEAAENLREYSLTLQGGG